MDTVGTSSLCPHYRESVIAGDYFCQIFAFFFFAWDLTAVGIIGVSVML